MLAAVILLTVVQQFHGQEVRRALPVDKAPGAWDQQAKFFAGIPLPEGAALAPLQKKAFYREHAATFEAMWARYNEHYFTPMRAWSALELAPRIPYRAPLIYFFGGPDALAAMAYYPEATDYLLGGLEPVGGFPPPDSLDQARLTAALSNLRDSTNVILSCGFFITKEMKAELELADFRGVMPLLMTFVAMSGGEVLDVTYFSIRKDAGIEETGPVPGEVQGKIPGVRVTFRRMPSSAPQRIHYVQADVSDGGLQAGSPVLAWAASLGRGNVYLKAASYLRRIFRKYGPFSFSRPSRSCRTIPAFRSAFFWMETGAAGFSGATRERWISSKNTSSQTCRRRLRQVPCRCRSAPVTSGGKVSPTCCWRCRRSLPVRCRSRNPPPSEGAKKCRILEAARPAEPDDDHAAGGDHIDSLAARSDHGNHVGRSAA